MATIAGTGRWKRCEANKVHRSEAEAASCPACHNALPTVTRQRKPAAIRHMSATNSTTNIDDQAPIIPDSWPSPSPSGATTSDSTFSALLDSPPLSPRTPLPTSSATANAYPTPQPSHTKSLFGAFQPAVSPTPSFTVRDDSPSPGPSLSHTGNFFANLFRQTSQSPNHEAYFPTSERRNAIAPEIDGFQNFEHDIIQQGQEESTTQPDILPEMATMHPQVNTPALAPTAPPPISATTDLATLHATRKTLTTNLQAATALINRLRTRETFALQERDRARENAAATREELQALRAERRREYFASIKVRCVLALIVVGCVLGLLNAANRWLYWEEFEWVRRRTGEVLGI
ncbi:hypothetical protein BDY17DRAFT_95745 [Neohortaea acidophila]|uniref:Uncharacterized protein n=1 Tax=Neohortaea acidophila TaxID=245834 RepID=A0A6A6PZ76_9PEZI|nr:uncharacterized protein BDY17DRAFT_95745 [Neohortaea acidophila]KAF2485044.1 hypothetical protein BDY17DRAFT_95745 [Neohortaea acidophila]